MPTMSKDILLKAVSLAGGQSALATGIAKHRPGCKVSQAHVWKWLNKAVEDVPPAEYVIPIAAAVEWQVAPHELRPDIYPDPADGLPNKVRPPAANHNQMEGA